MQNLNFMNYKNKINKWIIDLNYETQVLKFRRTVDPLFFTIFVQFVTKKKDG